MKRKKAEDRWLKAVRRLGYNSVGEALRDLYDEGAKEGRSVFHIGDLLGFTGMSVNNMMRRLGIKRRPRAPERLEIKKKWLEGKARYWEQQRKKKEKQE